MYSHRPERWVGINSKSLEAGVFRDGKSYVQRIYSKTKANGCEDWKQSGSKGEKDLWELVMGKTV